MPQKQENAAEDSAAVLGRIGSIFGAMKMPRLADPAIYLGMPMPILVQLHDALAMQREEDNDKRYRSRLRYAGINRERSSHTFKWDDDKYPFAAPGCIEEALSIEFIRNRKNLVVAGPPGVGKTMLVTVVVCKAIREGFSAKYKTSHEIATELNEVRDGNSLSGYIKKLASCDVLAIEDLPFASFDERNLKAFFSIIDARYERKSTLITTNKSFNDWADGVPDKSMALATIGRIAQDAVIINMNGAKDMRLAHAMDMLGIVAGKAGGDSSDRRGLC